MVFHESLRFSCDVLVIGGGGAGLRAAIEAKYKGAEVILVAKSRVGYANNTYIAKAVVSASGWGDPRDGASLHLKDTIESGCFLNDQGLVSTMVETAKDEISMLERYGVAFAKKKGSFIVEQVAGHRFPRQLRGQNRKGSDLILPLKKHAKKIGVRFVDRVFISRLLSNDGRVIGATGITHDGQFLVFSSASVILATGGFAQVYLKTDNAAGITGDGLVLAQNLGVPLKDMEFVQFYPTALGRFGNRLILSEVLVMAEGAILRNSLGEDIVQKQGIMDVMELTRDRLSQIIMCEIIEGRGIYGGIVMDLSPISDERLPLLASFLPATWHSAQKQIVVSPTAHFCMGGIVVNKNAETSILGLFSAGEVTGGIHGANRLGGNALCEVFTFGHIAGKMAAVRAGKLGCVDIPHQLIDEERARLSMHFEKKDENPRHLVRHLKEMMWEKAGILRDAASLCDALQKIDDFKHRAKFAQIRRTSDLIRCLELKNMLCLSEMVCRSALMRTESRGAHYRTDYPREDNNRWLRNIFVKSVNKNIVYELGQDYIGNSKEL